MDIIEPKRAMTEIKTSLDGLTSRVEMTEGRISKLDLPNLNNREKIDRKY